MESGNNLVQYSSKPWVFWLVIALLLLHALELKMVVICTSTSTKYGQICLKVPHQILSEK